ncbi:hypothetical protein CPB83DRAFT_599554 [Crepidotus variabilis]|uniref:Uncharacterized protein n=1 Tax=Crepidotus variabilis TaxID=179855 RepID=A0A9P6JLF8_9AGAR|nr:hypothetical protein CPB83DRAFT_599554 [Crepidotus variabilis]
MGVKSPSRHSDSLPCQIPGSRKSPTPRVPCPYKSPQSWVFYTFTLIFKEWMFFLAWAVTKGLAHITSVEVIADFLDIPWRPLSDGWVSHAMLWLRQRDLDIIKFHMEEDLEALADDISSPTYGIVSPGLYDTVASLQATKATVSSSDNHKLACIFRCFQDVTTNPDQSLPPTIRHFYHLGIQYVLTETLITDDQLVTPRPLDVSPESTKQFMADNARLWFLVDDSLGVQVVTPHHLELLVRVLRWPVEHINTEFKSFKSGGFYRGPFPVWPLLLRASASSQIPENLRATLRIQLGRVLIEFFEEAARYCPPKDIIGHTLLTTSYLQGQLRTGYFLSSDVVGFENLKKIFLPKILESFSQMKSGGLEFLLVAVAIFMNEQYFSKDSFTRQERDTIFRVLHAHNKCCDQTYIRTLLESISQYDDREWPADFIDRHLNDSDHPRQITQPESAPDFEEKISADHVFVDFSESVDPDCQDIMVQRRSVGLIEENGQQCLMGPSNTRHAWRVHPVSLRHEENSKGHLWDVSL